MPGSGLPKVKALFSTPEPPELGPGPRAGVLAESPLRISLEEFLSHSTLAPAACECVRALVFLWHDHLETAHQIAQEVGNRDGSFVHGIMHRREPDYGNAAYWFRRVGEHPCFPEMARRVTAMPAIPEGERLRAKLLPRAAWDPFAFIEACEAAAGGSFPESQRATLREIQRIETEVLFEHLLEGRAYLA
jgi:hypothetical protein